MANNDELVVTIEDRVQSRESDEAALRLFEETHVPVAPILSVKEAMEHPHLIERRTAPTINDPVMGEFQIPGMPLRFSDFPEEPPLQAVSLGENNREILASYPGYSEARIDELYEAGVIKTNEGN